METKSTIAASKKRSKNDPPDSCGKPGDAHDLEEGHLAEHTGPITDDCRVRLESRFVGGGGKYICELEDGQ